MQNESILILSLFFRKNCGTEFINSDNDAIDGNTNENIVMNSINDDENMIVSDDSNSVMSVEQSDSNPVYRNNFSLVGLFNFIRQHHYNNLFLFNAVLQFFFETTCKF